MTEASSKTSAGDTIAAGYSDAYSSAGKKAVSKYNSSANYGQMIDYSKNESEFYEHIKEYAPQKPLVNGKETAVNALGEAFKKYDIRMISNDMFKSRFFKGQYVTADKLADDETLSKYVEYAKNEAKADYFAIGIAYIVDKGINPNIGRNMSDAVVSMKIYSAQTGELLASSSLTETASGGSSDQACAEAAQKASKNLGQKLALQIRDEIAKRTLYGQEYILEIRGRLLPAERIAVSKALKQAEGIKNVSQRSSDTGKVEYVLNYSGSEPVGDVIFMNLLNASPKFNNYDYKSTANSIIFLPLGENL